MGIGRWQTIGIVSGGSCPIDWVYTPIVIKNLDFNAHYLISIIQFSIMAFVLVEDVETKSML